MTVKKSKILVTGLICIILFMSGQAFSESYLTYQNTENKFSIEYPSHWKKVEMNQNNMLVFAFVGPPEPPENKYRPAMTVAITKLHKPTTLDKFFESEVSNFDQPEKYLGKGTDVINGSKTRWIYYTKQSPGRKSTCMMYFFVKKDTAYILLGQSRSSTHKKFKPILNKMIRSFKI